MSAEDQMFPNTNESGQDEMTRRDSRQLTPKSETSLYVPDMNIRKAVSCFDMFFVDIKCLDPILYKEYTGGELSLAVSNLDLLMSLVDPQKVVVRIPVIPGYTSESDQRRYYDELIKMGISHFELFSYTLPETSEGNNS